MIQSAATGSHTEKIVEALVSRFRPACIYLFGSRARGDHRPDSDYDIYMEVSSENWPEDEYHTLNGVLIGFREAQVHVRVPGWLEAKKDEPGGIMYDVAREGLLLYNADGFRRVVPSEPPRRVREGSAAHHGKVAEWLRLARQDFDLALYLLNDIEKWKEPICFHAQQSAEKHIKAAIATRGTPLRVHELDALVEEARPVGFTLGGLDRRCRRLSRWATHGRYPADEGPAFPAKARVTADDALLAVEDARAIIAAVERELP